MANMTYVDKTNTTYVAETNMNYVNETNMNYEDDINVTYVDKRKEAWHKEGKKKGRRKNAFIYYILGVPVYGSSCTLKVFQSMVFVDVVWSIHNRSITSNQESPFIKWFSSQRTCSLCISSGLC